MSQMNKPNIPKAGRPFPVEGYGVPESEEGLLSWDFVVERAKKSRNYWIGTVLPDGRPHAMPVWGVWVDDRLHFGGGPHTRWSRNLEHQPHVVVHLESGDEVVIFEGTVTRITDPKSEALKRVDDGYEEKYKMRHGPPVWVLHPKKVFAWKEFPTSVTRWVFDES